MWTLALNVARQGVIPAGRLAFRLPATVGPGSNLIYTVPYDRAFQPFRIGFTLTTGGAIGVRTVTVGYDDGVAGLWYYDFLTTVPLATVQPFALIVGAAPESIVAGTAQAPLVGFPLVAGAHINVNVAGIDIGDQISLFSLDGVCYPLDIQ